jgi:hypothetical protein
MQRSLKGSVFFLLEYSAIKHEKTRPVLATGVATFHDKEPANTTMLNRMFFVFIIIFLLIKVTAELYTKYIYKQTKFK